MNKRTYQPKGNGKIPDKVPLLESGVNFNKFAANIIKEFEFAKDVESWSHKELGDFLIQEIWANEHIGTLKIAVLDRVIEELFKIQDEQDRFVECLMELNKINLKPNKNVKVPEYDKLSEGYNPDKIK